MRSERRRRAVLIAVMLFAASACGGKSSSAPTTVPPPTSGATTSTTPPAPTTTSLTLGPGQTLHKVDATFQYGAFVVTIGDAVYDATAKTVALGVRFANIGDDWHDLLAQGTLSAGGVDSPLIYDTQSVPARTSVDTTVTASGFDTDPTAAGVLAWGRPDRDVPKVHLSDGSVDGGWLPTPFPLDAWGSIGKYSVHVTSGEIRSGFGAPDQQADPGQRVVRFTFDEWAAHQDPVNGFYPTEHLTLVGPDGTEISSDQSSDGVAPESWSAQAGHWIEFPVPASFSGNYRLMLTSLSSKGFSTFHPELLEKAPIEVVLPAVVSRKAAPTSVPEPDLSKLSTTAQATGTSPVQLTLTPQVLNVPGFAITPTTFSWDPTAKTATLSGTATVIEANDNVPAGAPPTTQSPSTTALSANGAVSAAGSLLDAPPQLDFAVVLQSAHHNFAGTITTPPTVDRGVTASLSIEFANVDRLDPTDLSIAMGSMHSTPSTLPLTARAAFAQYPPEPKSASVTAATVSAGVWSMHVVSYRLGRLLTAPSPAPGQLDLELTIDVTISPNAPPKALGLSFRPVAQVFMARSDGYLGQAVADGGLVQFQPGETHRERVLFHVPDSFTPGTLGVVLRGGDELADVTTDVFPETTFTAMLTGSSALRP
jgi:hypothetical protein